jgi:3'(2'), 5'-bisphosphate nucleotidase
MSNTHPYPTELQLALQAVHTASLLTKSVLRSLKNNVSAETKSDDSPVTIADFAAQAILIAALHSAYPNDAFIGEESTDALRQNDALAQNVWDLVLRAKDEVAARPSKSGAVHLNSFPASKQDMFNLIDRGGKGSVTGSGRVWVMDPVDGTATFMQGQQYAVCLCLLVDGVQEVGVIGCPNLDFDVNGALGQYVHEDHVDEEGCGVVLSAVKGQGTYVRSMQVSGLGEPRRVDLSSLPVPALDKLNFVEATIGKTSLSQTEHKAVAESLGTTWPGTVLWSQQMKYVALTLGATHVHLRIPKTKDRFTYIWDHAGGHLLFQEAGGMIRDFNGQHIDFSQGRKIKGEVNYGMIATMPGLFEHVDRAVKDVLGQRGE